MERPDQRRYRRRAVEAVEGLLEAQQLRQMIHDHRMNHEGSSSESDIAESTDSDSEHNSDQDASGNDELDPENAGAVHNDNDNNNVNVENDGGDNADNVSDNADNVSDNDANEEMEAAAAPLNERGKEQYLVQSLREFGSSGGILSMTKLDELLGKLSFAFPSVPKSYKTLLSTAVDINIVNGNGFKFWYKGIKVNLQQLELDRYIERFGRIKIDVNMDGLPLSKTGGSKLKFWPNLGKLKGSENEPFIIALYCGESDPRDIDMFLSSWLGRNQLFRSQPIAIS